MKRRVGRVSDPANEATVGRVSDPADEVRDPATSEAQSELHLRRRLRRLPEIWGNHRYPIFFVTLCTADRRRILHEASVHAKWCDFARQSPARANAYVGRYVLMPDHIHAFVACESPKVLSAWTKALKGTLSKEFRGRGMSAPFWQDGFFDHLLRSGESYGEKWEYIRRNPERAGLVARAEDWPYAGEIEVLSWD